MLNYDQWKTASPYDDDIDWGEYGAKCPECKSDQFEVVSSDADQLEIDCECNDCSYRFIFPIPECLQHFDEPTEQLSIFDEETTRTPSGLTYDDPEIFRSSNDE
jgi:hypothetical protein